MCTANTTHWFAFCVEECRNDDKRWRFSVDNDRTRKLSWYWSFPPKDKEEQLIASPLFVISMRCMWKRKQKVENSFDAIVRLSYTDDARCRQNYWNWSTSSVEEIQGNCSLFVRFFEFAEAFAFVPAFQARLRFKCSTAWCIFIVSISRRMFT